MDAVTFSTTSNILGNRTVRFGVSDGGLNSNVFERQLVVGEKPVITITNTNQFYGQGGAAIAIDPNIQITDADSLNLASGTVSITAGFNAGDTLGFTNNNAINFDNIAASYNAGTGVLTLSSAGATATKAQWQAAYDAVTFVSTSNNLGNRTVRFVVNDGGLDSTAVTRQLVVEAPPVLTGSGSTSAFTLGGGPILVDRSVMVSDLDNSDQLSGTVSIAAGRQAGDVLAFTNTSNVTFGNISATYNAGTGVLSLSSAGQTASNAQWQAAFDAVTFTTTSSSTQNRSITFVVNDSIADSNSVTQSVSVTVPPASQAGQTVIINGQIGTTIDTGKIGNTNIQGLQFQTSNQTLKQYASGTLYAPYNFVTGDGPSRLGMTNYILLLDAGLASGTLRESNGSVTQTDLINLTPAIQVTRGSIYPPIKLTSTLFQDALKPLGGDNNSKLNYLSLTDIGGEPLNVAFRDASKSYNNALNFLVINDDNNMKGKIDLNAYKGLALISGPVTVNGVGQDNEVIDAGNGATFNLRNGGSSIVVAQGGSTINGGTGVDTVILSGTASSAAHVTKDNNGVTHITMPSQGNTDLTGVERIQFTDGTLALDTGPNSAVRQAYSLYSLLGRPPDKAGLGYWINALETGSMDTLGIVDSFLNTSEYSDAHGGNKGYSLANTTNVTALYRDLLHREPDQLGLWYWTSNGFNLRTIVSAFLEAEEFKTIIGASLNDGVFYTPYL